MTLFQLQPYHEIDGMLSGAYLDRGIVPFPFPWSSTGLTARDVVFQ